MYSDEQYYKTLEVYEKTKSVIKTIAILGHPSRTQTLYNWIHRKRILPEERSTLRGYNTEDHRKRPTKGRTCQTQSASEKIALCGGRVFLRRLSKIHGLAENPHRGDNHGKESNGIPGRAVA